MRLPLPRDVGRRVRDGRAVATSLVFGVSLLTLTCCTEPSAQTPPAGDASPQAPATPTTTRVELPERRLEWADDFDGPEGSAPDPSTWTAQVGGEGWGNRERQYYTDSRANASLDGQGRLVITARRATGDLTCWYGPCRYTSARLTTSAKRSWTYGRVEATLKAPRGAGLWPAFWMLGENFHEVPYPQAGEIDIMEIVGDRPEEAWASVHGPGFVGGDDTTRAFSVPGEELTAGFHTYAVDREPGRIMFAVDGQVFYTVTKDDVGDGTWVFDAPFHVLLNLAVGGDWPKDPTPDTEFPASMIVDRVAYYR